MKSWKERLRAKKEEGAALVIAIILLSAIEILGFALITMSEIDYSVATNITRSDEALYTAEQGIMMMIDFVNRSEVKLSLGQSIQRCSALFRGKGIEKATDCTNPQDPFPRWVATLISQGYAPPTEKQSPNAVNYRYLIESRAFGTMKGLERTIRVMMVFSPPAGKYVEKEGKKLFISGY